MPTWFHHMGAAVGAGAVADTITNPLWVIRTRMQAAILREESALPTANAGAAGATAASGGGAKVVQAAAPASAPANPPKVPSATAATAATAKRAAAATATPRNVMHHHRHHSMATVAADMLKHEGPRAFYKGLTATYLGLSHVAVQFPLYEHLKATARERRGSAAGSEEAVDLVLASATSKLIASVITYPHEVIRARMQFSLGTRNGPMPGQ